MKKLILLIIMMLGLFIMPNVYAEELPREGVTYFMQYPNGEEVATESYDEAVTYPEKIVFEGTTDSNGQVSIEGLGDQGEVRIVEEVPDGYTTKTKEVKVDLSNKKNVEITNTPKLVKVLTTNPKTGMSFLIFIFVIGLTIYTVKTKKNKKLLAIIPVMLGMLLVSDVQAAESSFKVTVKDDNGNAQSGVTVKVYAKPINIDAAPAIKFDANGGVFPNGKSLMYYRIPYNGCSMYELYNYLGEDEWNRMNDNIGNAYKEGYYVSNISGLETYSNGTTITLQWEEKTDGIYVNNIPYLGSPDNCFENSIDFWSNNYIGFETGYSPYLFGIYGMNENTMYIKLFMRELRSSKSQSGPNPINKVEIVYHGNTIVSLDSNDLVIDDESYRVTNQTKQNIINDYINLYYNNSSCFDYCE